MWDLSVSSTSHQIINEFYAHNRIISAVCHGPAALAKVKLTNGTYLLANQPVTGFSNTEESAMGLTEQMPFSLEDELEKASGGKYVKAESDWGVKVAVGLEGRLITGQNPASATAVGKAIYDSIFGKETTRDEV